jgi:hypothetical protein
MASTYQGIEEKLECSVSLTPVLGPEPDENDLAFTMSDIDHCRLIGKILLPYQPAALQEIPLLVADNSFIPLTVLG